SLLPKATGEMLVEVAMALWKIERYSHSRDYIISVLRGTNRSRFQKVLSSVFGDERGGRWAAADALKHFKCKESMRALLDALNDEDSLVRDRAARSLFEHLHLLDPSFPGDFVLLGKLASDKAGERSGAKSVVRKWIEEKGYL